MLVLTRRKNETIIIGEGANAIKIKVLAFNGSRVRLGIEAPKDVNIRRNELPKEKNDD